MGGPVQSRFAPYRIGDLNLGFLKLFETPDLELGGAIGRTCPVQVRPVPPQESKSGVSVSIARLHTSSISGLYFSSSSK